MKSECLVVIPARLASERFPAKVLATLAGRPIVEWCRRAAVYAGVGPVVVATDHVKVVRAVEYFGGEAVLTSPDCRSGTDRVWEAARRSKARFIINLQGDEPLIQAATIRRVAAVLGKNPMADLSTAVAPLADPRRARDPNLVKAAVASDGRCLYFSRAPIPFPRREASENGSARYLQHIGVYGYTRKALERFVSLPQSPLERVELLEQLRALEAGMSIFAALVSNPTVAIDTPADLARARRVARDPSKKAGAPHG